MDAPSDTPQPGIGSSPLPELLMQPYHDCSVSQGGSDAERSLPMLSIVVPVRNESAFIGQTLDRLLSQDYPHDRFEILVVDGMSTDATCQIVQQYVDTTPNVKLLRNDRRWSSAGRNVGVAASRGEIIAVIDGHCQLPDRQHFQALAAGFSRSRAMILGRPQPLTVQGANALQRAIAWARASRLGHHPDSYIYANGDQFVPALSVGAAYRREVFDQIGQFDERFDACEDVDFNYRADQQGISCYLAASARVHYYPRATLAGLFRQLSRYGRGRVRLARKHPATWSWKSLAPAMLLAWCLLLLATAAWSHAANWILAITLAGYVFGVLSVSVRLAVQAGPDWAVCLLPLVFFTIHLGAGWGALQELVCGFRRMNV